MKKSVNIYILVFSPAQINLLNSFLCLSVSMRSFQPETKYCQVIFEVVCREQPRQLRSTKHENGSGVCNVTLTWSRPLGSWLNASLFLSFKLGWPKTIFQPETSTILQPLHSQKCISSV